jgi:hypothetical protein
MSARVRYATLLASILGLALAGAFYFQWSWLQNLWPWSGGYAGSGDLSSLSFYFLSSILAAVALPNLWIGLTGEFAAMKPGAINLAITFAGISVYVVQSYAATNRGPLLIAALLCIPLVVVAVAVLIWTWRQPLKDSRPMPLFVRLAFGVFAAALIIVGGALVLRQPNIFPWPLRDEMSVVYGWIFLGAAAYFIYGILVPKWHNACGQLIGFLAYDLVLIVPFVGFFAEVRPVHLTSLIVYTAVVVLSGILAAYYLFVEPVTRIWGPSPAASLAKH